MWKQTSQTGNWTSNLTATLHSWIMKCVIKYPFSKPTKPNQKLKIKDGDFYFCFFISMLFPVSKIKDG